MTKYLDRHLGLRLLLEHYPVTFTVLKPEAQQQLHLYYQTSVGASDDELVEGRAHLNIAQPALTHLAGKAFNRLYDCFQIASDYAQGDDIRFHKAIAALAPEQPIRAAVRHEIDASKLLGALQILAEELKRDDELAA